MKTSDTIRCQQTGSDTARKLFPTKPLRSSALAGAWKARACLLSACVGFAAAWMAGSAQAFTIIPKFESSWSNNAPASATADVNFIVNEFQSLFNNPVTITLQFGWGDYAGTNAWTSGAAAWFPQLWQASPAQYTFGQTTNFMGTHATAHPENTPINTGVSHFPGSYPNPNGTNAFFISDAEYKALTGAAQNTDAIDAYIAIGSGTTWGYGGTAVGAGSNFFRGALEHEISHAMGRFDIAYGAALGGGPSFLTPLDFYKYSVGTTTLNPTRTVTGFSVDGGTTQAFEQFNASSDSSDWNNTSTNSFNATLSGFQTMNATDIAEMQALGWDVPEPGSLSLLVGGGALGLACARRQRRRQ